MNTLDQINDFSAFAKSRLGRGDQVDQVGIDQLYDEWRSKAFADMDSLAIRASVRDLESGERGEPVDQFLADFEKLRKQDSSE